jgi:hypothetical protein
MEDLERTIQSLPPQAARLKEALQTLLAASDGNLTRFRESVADWFNSAMERLSGWYKRRSQVLVFCIGLVLAGAYNIDTIQVVNQLSRDGALRTAMVSAAENQQRAGLPADAGAAQERLEAQMKVLGDLGLPLGWSSGQDTSKTSLADIRRPPVTPMGWVLKVLGLLLTALAVSLGAPFWFDVLNKIVVVRSTVSPGEKARKERRKREVPA